MVFDKNGALLQNNITSIANPNGGTINIDLGSPYDANKPGSGYSGIYIKQGVEKNVFTQQDGVAEGFLNNIIYPMMEVLLRNLAMVKMP